MDQFAMPGLFIGSRPKMALYANGLDTGISNHSFPTYLIKKKCH